MGVQLINGFGGIQTYYRASQIPSVSQREAQQQVERSLPQEEIGQEASRVKEERQPRQEADRPSKTADLENISLTFHKEESFDYIGSESGLENLDVQKAISDMRKDQVLEQYQQFVGSARSFFTETEDGIVIPKSQT